MVIDILFGILIIFALLRGYRQGLILGIFSLLAIIIGLAAALKLSAVVASRLGKVTKVSEEWLPFISFIVVFLVVIILVRLGAKFLERTAELAMLGWLNKMGGMVLFVLIYTIVFSIILFYAEQMNILKPSTIQSSFTYSFIKPWGPKTIDALGSVIPFFKNMFDELSGFFGSVANKVGG